MKKILVTIVVCFLMVLMLSGCNRQIVDLNYKFTHVHFYETGKCYEIKSWRDYEESDQIQITLKDGTVILVHSTDCALIKGNCIFCEESEGNN